MSEIHQIDVAPVAVGQNGPIRVEFRPKVVYLGQQVTIEGVEEVDPLVPITQITHNFLGGRQYPGQGQR